MPDFGDIKDSAFRCMACFCVDHSLTFSRCCDPCLMISGKCLCCRGDITTQSPFISCGVEGCYTEESGCLETKQKLCCTYEETQCPPSVDIGLACCGLVCVGQQASAREGTAREVPLQLEMN
eukprot:TRINITY_DN4105_c0_g1_i6.p1 TRINITY_DN4105_c0_g1~~TRINITY_DN4105_c0_g1_i6.p1  ORF type:complete len:122 (+),score=12.62 TRINITY_DN4105_c0_g1_i6:69-434(+)